MAGILDIVNKVLGATQQQPQPETQRKQGALTYKPQHMDETQIKTESNFRQFDKNGKPLVGRYRDGTTPKPNERAYGVGQIQIGTARATAQKHGIPWSQGKLLNDPNYNLELADRHMGDLLEKYKGDRTLARAAYHSGEPKVDRALAAYGREGFAKGLGPHGRDYIRMGTKAPAKGTGPQQGVSDPARFLAGLESSLGPEARASQNVSSSTATIFGSDAEMSRRSGAVEADMQKQGQQLDVLTAVTEVAQTQQMASKVAQLEETRAISNEIVQGTQELKRKVMPIFEARGRVADQLDKVATMNPLEAGFRGIFDLNYDRQYLTGQLDQFDRTLQMRAQDFDYLNNLHKVGLAEIDRRYGLDTALSDLTVEQAKEDLNLVGLRIQQSSGMLATLRDRISGEAQLIAAKAGARDDMLSRLDTPTLGDLMTTAQQSGGVVSHNGVEFSYGELRDRMEAQEIQQLGLESHRMAIANSRMDLAEGYARQVARSLTREQAEAAMAAGGVWQGVQLPQDVLNQVWQGHVQVAQQRAETIQNTLPAQQALKVGTDALNYATGLYYRSKGLLGDSGMASAKTSMEMGSNLIRELMQATENGSPPEVIAAITTKIAQNSQAFEAQVDRAIVNGVGGDKRAAGYVKAFVSGTPMNAGAATEAITYFALKGSLPEGMASSPEAKQIFAKAQATVGKYRTQKNPATNKPYTEAQLQQVVTQEVGKAAAQIVGQARFDRIQYSLPSLAKQAGHPLGKLNPIQWRDALSNSQAAAVKQLAVRLNTTPEVVRQMATKFEAIDATPAAKDLFTRFAQAQPIYNAIEQSELVRAVDELPQVSKGVPNSSMLQHFLASPELHKQSVQVSQLAASNSMGDFLINPLSAGAVESNIGEWGLMLGQAHAAQIADSRASGRKIMAGYGNDPRTRVGVILSTIPGVGKEGAGKLMPFIQEQMSSDEFQQLTAQPMSMPNLAGNRPGPVIRAQESFIRDALSRVKFPDPASETYRKLAVKNWDSSSTQADSFVDNLMDAMNLDILGR